MYPPPPFEFGGGGYTGGCAGCTSVGWVDGSGEPIKTGDGGGVGSNAGGGGGGD